MADRTLVIDTATTACSIALIEDERVLAERHDVVGRGHAERLIPMIAELPGGGRAERILVDVGPGSFTGIRVGIAAARGLALGWGAAASGYSSLALIAQGVVINGQTEPFAIVIEGGHGEVFMQGFSPDPLLATDALASLKPGDALARLAGRRAFGGGTRWLTDLPPAQNGGGDWLPVASVAPSLPEVFRTMPPRPLYGRAPDAKLPA